MRTFDISRRPGGQLHLDSSRGRWKSTLNSSGMSILSASAKAL